MTPFLRDQAADWQFVGTSGAAGRVSEEENGLALVIEHPSYIEGSRWEQIIAEPVPGTLLTLSATAQTQGDCWKKISQDRVMSGAEIGLGAFGHGGAGEKVSLGAVEFVFFPPSNPDGTLQKNVPIEGSVRLTVPEGTEFVRASAELSGQGAATFSGFSLAAEPADAGQMNDALVDSLKAAGTIQSSALEHAFRSVARHHFLPKVNWGRVYQDDAIATHFAEGGEVSVSASSQPTVMALMLEQLEVAPGMRVLEIGAGTGYNAALLARLAEGGENVWAIDVEEEFCAEARANLASAGVSGVSVLCADGWNGWPDAAPYDRILVTANAHDIAPAWFDQLREGGRLVLPWGAPNASQRSIAFRKEAGRLVMESLHFCGFMEMRGAYRWVSPPNGSEGRNWSDWLFPGQPPGDPSRLAAYPVGSAPTLGAEEHLARYGWFEYIASWN